MLLWVASGGVRYGQKLISITIMSRYPLKKSVFKSHSLMIIIMSTMSNENSSRLHSLKM